MAPTSSPEARALAKQIIAANADGNSESWTEAIAIRRGRNMLCAVAVSPAPSRFATAPMPRSGSTEPRPQAVSLIWTRPQPSTDQSWRSRTQRASARSDAFAIPMGKCGIKFGSTDDPQVRAMFVRQVGDCPAGRLVAWDKASGRAIEPHLPVSIGLIEDPVEGCSGPIWLRGGIPVVSADGFDIRGAQPRNPVPLWGVTQSHFATVLTRRSSFKRRRA